MESLIFFRLDDDYIRYVNTGTHDTHLFRETVASGGQYFSTYISAYGTNCNPGTNTNSWRIIGGEQKIYGIRLKVRFSMSTLL